MNATITNVDLANRSMSHPRYSLYRFPTWATSGGLIHPSSSVEAVPPQHAGMYLACGHVFCHAGIYFGMRA